MTTPEDDYPCVGVCMVDAETGYCLGCGRPPLGEPATGTQENAEVVGNVGIVPDTTPFTVSGGQRQPDKVR